MKKILMVAFAVVLFAAPAFAVESGTRPLSILEFSAAPENRGMSQRLVERRYAEYRNGRFAVTTLDTAHIR